MKHLYKKELDYYFNSPVGYIIIILFAVFANFLFVKDIFVVGSASMRSFFGLVPWLLLIFVPALTMRIFSEEKRTNTIEILLTLPISETEIVLTKFFALLTLLTISLVLTAGLPISLFILAKLYLPEIIIGYLGAVLLGGGFIAITMFFSSQTKNQVVVFLISIITLFFLMVLGADFMETVLPKTILDYLNYLTPMYHLGNFIKGIIDVRSLVYFLSLIIISLFLTVISLEKRE